MYDRELTEADRTEVSTRASSEPPKPLATGRKRLLDFIHSQRATIDAILSPWGKNSLPGQGCSRSAGKKWPDVHIASGRFPLPDGERAVIRQNFSGLFDVSRLTLGGGGIGQVWGETSQEEAIATVHSAYEHGINFFDLAPLYGRGEAETVMGLAFPDGYPDEVHLTTKCMLGSTEGPLVEQALSDSLNKSLARMKRDSVDVFILHGYVIPDNWTSPLRGDILSKIAVEWTTYCNHVIPAFEKLKSSGRINAWGITAASTQVTNLAAIESAQHPDVVQCITNLLDSPGSMAISDEPPDPRGVISAAKKENLGVMGIRAVAAGSLTDRIDRTVKESSTESLDFDRAGRFRQLAAELDTTPAKLAHQYALTMNGVDTVVLGVKNRDELLECIDAESQPNLSPEVVALIDQAVA